jgi:hypothetical protein
MALLRHLFGDMKLRQLVIGSRRFETNNFSRKVVKDSRITRLCIPEERKSKSHRCEDLKFHSEDQEIAQGDSFPVKYIFKS